MTVDAVRAGMRADGGRGRSRASRDRADARRLRPPLPPAARLHARLRVAAPAPRRLTTNVPHWRLGGLRGRSSEPRPGRRSCRRPGLLGSPVPSPSARQAGSVPAGPLSAISGRRRPCHRRRRAGRAVRRLPDRVPAGYVRIRDPPTARRSEPAARILARRYRAKSGLDRDDAPAALFIVHEQAHHDARDPERAQGAAREPQRSRPCGAERAGDPDAAPAVLGDQCHPASRQAGHARASGDRQTGQRGGPTRRARRGRLTHERGGAAVAFPRAARRRDLADDRDRPRRPGAHDVRAVGRARRRTPARTRRGRGAPPRPAGNGP